MLEGLKDSERKFEYHKVDSERLDVWLTNQLAESRSQIKTLIENGHILVNGQSLKAGYPLRTGDQVCVSLPHPKPIEVMPQNIPLDIVYEDHDLVVINKSKNMVVHPATGNWDNTLVNALLYHCSDLSGIGGKLRPGIVHRLDKDTTGLMVVAKNDRAHHELAKQLKDRLVKRHYVALAHGVFKETDGVVNAPIGRHPVDRKKMAVVANGRMAITNYYVKEVMHRFSLVECRLETGRTHQIRVHMASIHHSIVGDQLYGPKQSSLGAESQLLHAFYLEFTHPSKGKMEFSCECPASFNEFVDKSRKMS